MKLSGEMSGKKETTKPGTVVFMLLFSATNNYEPQKKSFLESMELFLVPNVGVDEISNVFHPT